ncbi:hypothetical protein MITS9504_02425 [Synechococcus sp. MIT S9504]|nr:hypothetical protein MITS9504_02425 [Synechococcus sp. MIT S9504]
MDAIAKLGVVIQGATGIEDGTTADDGLGLNACLSEHH